VLVELGDTVTEVSGRLHTFLNQRPGAPGSGQVTVDDAAWATLTLASGAVASMELSRMATGTHSLASASSKVNVAPRDPFSSA
jgi:hypothetical protein